jgi:hypothetical protein
MLDEVGVNREYVGGWSWDRVQVAVARQMGAP